ncbi:MAG TPA: Gfo/Idh/MocA family oxidoreductase [Bryobacteraceae bacterium]|jgi:predicted dehydrogenase
MADRSAPLKWLVIGIGDITTRRVIPAILEEKRSRLVGIVTRDPAKAVPYKVPAWTNLDAALRESGADAVYVGTPVALHMPQAIEALEAGKDVLCEKPVAMNYAQAARMQEAAEQTRRVFGVAYYRRLYDKVQRAKALLDSGVIGRPVIAEATCHDWFHPVDGFRGWLVDPAMAGGGPLYDIASHRIDLMNFFFGKPSRVTGQLSTLVQPAKVEDNATVLIEYENGVRAMVDVRWHSRTFRDEFRIRGTEGEINLTPLTGPELSYPNGQEELPAPQNLHFPCVENYVSAVLEGAPLVSSGKSAIVTDWVTEQVIKSGGAVSYRA